MTDQVVPPHEVLAGDLREKLVDAMFDAYMAKGAVESGAISAEGSSMKFTGQHGSTYRYEVEWSWTWNPEIECRMPSGEWVWTRPGFDKENLQDDPEVEHNTKVTLFDAPAVRGDIQTLVDAWLDPWVEDSPSPNEYTNQITSLARIAQQLYVGSTPVTGEGVAPPVTADSDLWNAMSQFAISADSQSIAIDLFQQSYATDIWKTVGGQQALAYFAGTALTAEAAAWNASYVALRDLVKAAVADFESFAASHDASGADAGVLTAVSTVAGLLGATGGVVFPPFGVAMGVVSSGIGFYQLVAPGTPAVQDRSLRLDGSTFEDKVTSFTDAITAIDTEHKNAEQEIAQSCVHVVGQVEANPDNFSLSRGWRRSPATNRQGPGDDVDRLLHADIDLVPAKMKKVAGACEAVSDHLRGVASVLGGNDHAGNPSAVVADEWSRGSLPGVGTIGIGYDGPLPEFRALIDLLTDLLIEDGKTSHQVAEWLGETILDMENVDAGSAGALGTLLDRLSSEFDQHRDASVSDPDAPRASVFAGNDPSHP